MFKPKLTGLIAAVHSPFHANGSLNLAVVEKQAAHLLANKITTAFICGTTGESHSLTLEERRALAVRWMEVARGTELQIIVHVGTNCLADSRVLAAQAQQIGALAVSALAPSYFKPRSVATLVDCCADIASAAPELPFFYYDIPVFTGVSLSMPDFLAQAEARIPNLAGIKFSNADLMMFQQCLRAADSKFSIPWGYDESLLAALALGATSAVGSSYNLAAPVYHRLLKAFAAGDLGRARDEQFCSVQLVATLASRGYMGAAKAVMRMLGVDVGPARLPNTSLDAQQQAALRAELERLGFFDWVKP
ncbi:MAG TPA: dihydrodipicolinate synthase family protein [Methylomirabilota bacterium]|nr:dihydrodipicolinate synthase family protein [Methylomirabilota bacterium]